MPNEINATLRQQGSYGHQREYQIINGQHIRIAIGKKGKLKSFAIPMLALAGKSKSRLHIAWAWFWLAIGGVAAIPVYLSLKDIVGLKTQGLDFPVIAGLVVMALIGLLMVGINFSRKRVYFTVYSKVPLLEILVGKPDSSSYKNFLKALDGYIQHARTHWELRDEQQVAGELRMLRRLASEGVISQKVYEQAKDKMFVVNNKSTKAVA